VLHPPPQRVEQYRHRQRGHSYGHRALDR
jgi:hypothetical protein